MSRSIISYAHAVKKFVTCQNVYTDHEHVRNLSTIELASQTGSKPVHVGYCDPRALDIVNIIIIIK